MKKYWWIAIVLLVPIVWAGTDGGLDGLLRFDKFVGNQGAEALGVDLSVAEDMMNFEVETSGGSAYLKQRDGFSSFGSGLGSYPVQGIFRYTPQGGPNRLLVANGTSLYAYNESTEKYAGVSGSIFTGTCSVTQGSKWVYGIGTNWFPASTWDVDTIAINDFTAGDGTRYVISKILGDSVIYLEEPFAEATDGGAVCTLFTHFDPPTCENRSTGGGSEVFEDAYTKKRGTMFGDTLVIVDGDSLIKHYGGAAIDVSVDHTGDSLSSWIRKGMTIKILGVDGKSIANSWYQIQNKYNQGYNLALWCINTGWKFRVDSQLYYDWLYVAEDTVLSMIPIPIDSLYFTEQVYNGLVEGVTLDSFVTTEVTHVTINGLVVDDQEQWYAGESVENGSGTPDYPNAADWYRTRSIYQYNYIFEWKITRLKGTDWFGNIPMDTLVYMTVVAGNRTDTTTYPSKNDGDIGSYVNVLPVKLDTLRTWFWDHTAIGDTVHHFDDTTDCTGACDSITTGDTVLFVYTYGPAGTWYKDTTIWTPENDYYSEVCTGEQDWDIEGAVDEAAGNCQIAWSRYAHPQNTNRDIIHIGDTSLGALVRNDVNTAFEVNDSLCLYRMGRYGEEAFNATAYSSIVTNYNIVHEAMGRLWYAGRTDDSSAIVAYSKSTASSDIRGYEMVRPNAGSYITALSSWDSYVFAHMPDGIAAMSCYTFSDTARGIYAGTPQTVEITEASEGAVSQEALVQMEKGDVFVGANGVFIFNGGPLEKISGAINHIIADSLDRSQMSNVCAGKYLGDFWFSYTQIGNDHNNRTLVYDFDTGLWWKFDVGASLFFDETGVDDQVGLYWGSPQTNTQGYVMQYGRVATDTNTYIDAWWLSPWWSGGALDQRKSFQKAYWWVKSNATATYNLTIYENHSETAAHTSTLRPGSAGWSIESQPVTASTQSEVVQFKIDLDSAAGVKVRELDVRYRSVGDGQ